MQAAKPTFKLVLVGDGCVSKITFVKRHLAGEFEKKYVATLGVEVHPLEFHTNRVRVCASPPPQPPQPPPILIFSGRRRKVMRTSSSGTPSPPFKLPLPHAPTPISHPLLGVPFSRDTAVCPVHLQDQLIFNVWDTAGQEKFGGLRDGYYIQGQYARARPASQPA